MAEERSNKKCATDEDIGNLHHTVTLSLDMKLKMQLEGVKRKLKKAKKKAKKKGKKIKDKDLSFMLSTNDILAAARWCKDNKIIARDDDIVNTVDTIDELEQIRQRQRGKKNQLKAVGDD